MNAAHYFYRHFASKVQYTQQLTSLMPSFSWHSLPVNGKLGYCTAEHALGFIEAYSEYATAVFI